MKAKRMVALFTGLALMLVALVIAQTGCCAGYPIRPVADSHFGIIGRAYEWVNALPDATGEVLYQEYNGTLDETVNEMLGKEASQGHQFTPLEGVKVVAAPDYGGGWSLRAVSDGKGFLAGGETIPTYGADWGFIFSKSGYREVTQEIHQDALNYVLVVIMVREDSPE